MTLLGRLRFWVTTPPQSSRYHLNRWVAARAKTVDPSALVLDAGAGSGPYAHHFSHVHYESADFGKVDKGYIELTYVCDISSIPVEDQRFDAVLCNQTLEHVRHPDQVLSEFYRILRPGGALWLTVPLFYQEHEQPYDNFRYTQFALRDLFEVAGFVVDEIEWLEGYYGTLAYQCHMAATDLPTRLAPIKLLFLLAAHAFSRMDMRTKLTTTGMCKNYAVLATKRNA